ncbi:hypothetical protein ACLOJK_011433 [Asimina triloba]
MVTEPDEGRDSSGQVTDHRALGIAKDNSKKKHGLPEVYMDPLKYCCGRHEEAHYHVNCGEKAIVNETVLYGDGDGKAMKLKTSLKLGFTDLLEDIGADGDEDIEGYSACCLALFDRISAR